MNRGHEEIINLYRMNKIAHIASIIGYSAMNRKRDAKFVRGCDEGMPAEIKL
jgi:hypothetical protein